MTSPITKLVDAIYIINLPSRTDRRNEIAEQLTLIALNLESPEVTLFPAHRPDDAGGFDTVGAHGCFLSHLDVLRDAKHRKLSNILILEDDVDFSDNFVNNGQNVIHDLLNTDWAITYLGHLTDNAEHCDAVDQTDQFFEIPPDQSVMLAHAILFRSSAIDELVPYLETMLARAPGHPDGGPMHIDGAYGWFRKANPDLKTFASFEQLAVQRASRTDIHDTGWKESLPFINKLRRLKNKLPR